MRSWHELRRESVSRKAHWIVPGVLVIIAIVLAAVSVYALAPSKVVANQEGSSSIATTTPAPAPLVSKTPTATPTPTASSTPAPPLPCIPDGTTISIPKAEIDRAPVRAFTDADWQEKTVYNPHTGSYDKSAGVSPVGDFDMVFYDRLQTPGSCLSSEATNTNYLYCHSNRSAEALCNDTVSLVAGDSVVIETPSERLTYTMVEASFPVYKVDFNTDTKVVQGESGRLVITTCRKDGERDGNSATTQVTVSIFQLSSVQSLVTAVEVPIEINTDPQIASRLE